MYLKTPHLPTKDITKAIISSQNSDILVGFKSLGIDVIPSKPINGFENVLKFHPDLQILHLGDDKFITGKNCDSYILESATKIKTKLPVNETYPNDCLINIAIVGKKAILNKDIVDKTFLENFSGEVLHTKQGYAKCSILVCDTDCIITDDKSIYSLATENNIESMLVSKGSVQLDGFDYGFIGGAGGKISNDIMAFAGDVKKHTDGDSIKSFLRNRNIYCQSVTSGNLVDIGSIIQLEE